MRPGYEHEYEDGRRCLGGGGDFLFLSIRLALRAVRHDAAVIRGFRAQFDWAWPRSWACSTTDIRHSALLLALPWTGWDRGVSFPIAAAVVGVGALLFATGRSDLASVGRVLQGAGGVFALVGAIYIATKNFPRVAGRYFDRRYPDVRNGGRIGRAVCRWANDRRRDRLGPFLDRYGRYRFGDGCPSLCSPTKRKENRAVRQWIEKHHRRVSTPYSRIRNRYCAA